MRFISYILGLKIYPLPTSYRDREKDGSYLVLLSAGDENEIMVPLLTFFSFKSFAAFKLVRVTKLTRQLRTSKQVIYSIECKIDSSKVSAHHLQLPGSTTNSKFESLLKIIFFRLRTVLPSLSENILGEAKKTFHDGIKKSGKEDVTLCKIFETFCHPRRVFLDVAGVILK